MQLSHAITYISVLKLLTGWLSLGTLATSKNKK
jgi:hypothetical protein